VKHKMGQNKPILGLIGCLMTLFDVGHVAYDAGRVRLGRGWLWDEQIGDEGRRK
jgi:hypothetical protein